jgi:predicted DNA-binding transcriptional regulator AlpA
MPTPTRTSPATPVPAADRLVFTPREVAELLTIKVGTLKEWRARGAGPRCVRLATSRVVYERGEVLRWLSEETANGSPEKLRLAQEWGARGARRAKELGRQGGRPRENATTPTTSGAARP